MADVVKLKEKARALELKSQWRPALEVYQRLTDEEAEDISLWNRIGDLHLRLGEAHRAVEAYERGVEAYVDAGLLNNAIALCNKILRTAPERTIIYRKLARFTASQGFLADARAHFLRFAERMHKLGHHEEALDALREAAGHLPHDVELRRMLADQLHAAGRTEEAVTELRGLLSRGEIANETADAVRAQLLAIDPRAGDAPLPPAASSPPQASEPQREVADWPDAQTEREEEPATDASYGELGIERSAAFEAYDDPDPGPIEGFERVQHEAADSHAADGGDRFPLMDLQLEGLELRHEESDSAPDEPLPTLSLEDDWSGGSDGSTLWDERHDLAEGRSERQTATSGSSDDALDRLRARLTTAPEDHVGNAELARALREQGRSDEVEALLDARHTALAASGRYAEAAATARTLLEVRDEDTALYQQQVEYAVRAGAREPLIQAYLDLAHHLTGAASAAKAREVYGRVLELDPANEEARRALSPVPPPPHPGGTDGHFDRGLAYKESGRFDEAIAELQAALREGSRPIPTLEALGECFHAKGQFSLAARVLDRALRESAAADEELVGVHYWLGRSQEALGEAHGAREHYERVLAYDILYRDARSRFAALPETDERPRP